MKVKVKLILTDVLGTITIWFVQKLPDLELYDEWRSSKLEPEKRSEDLRRLSVAQCSGKPSVNACVNNSQISKPTATTTTAIIIIIIIIIITTNDGRNKTTKSRKESKCLEKKTWEYQTQILSNMRRWKKNCFKISQESEITTQNQTTEQKSHQTDKHIGCPPRMIFGTIPKVDQKWTSTNGPGNKKTHDNA